MKTTKVIYHRADYDGLFCKEIARKFLAHKTDLTLIGWDYGDPVPSIDLADKLYILDLSIPELMLHPNLIWIDHHKSAIDKYSVNTPGYRIDGVAACRLCWQWFLFDETDLVQSYKGLPIKEDFVKRTVIEPYAVQLAGEYDIWDKRNKDAEIFQHGLNSCEIPWDYLLNDDEEVVSELLSKGSAVQYAMKKQNSSIIKSQGYDLYFEELVFLACNAARYNSLLFEDGIKPYHEALLGFSWDGQKWKISLYGLQDSKIDLSLIAVKYGGGGHRNACGFTCSKLPFDLASK